MMNELAKSLDNILVIGSMVEGIIIDPLRSIKLSFIKFPTKQNSLNIGFDIQFNKVLNFGFSIDILPDVVQDRMSYVDKKTVCESENDWNIVSRKIRREELARHKIVLEHGFVDVVAEEFTYNVIWEI